MQLNEKQIASFWEIMKKHDDKVSGYTDFQKAEIANGIANFFVTSTELFLKRNGGNMEKCAEMGCGKSHEKEQE